MGKEVMDKVAGVLEEVGEVEEADLEEGEVDLETVALGEVEVEEEGRHQVLPLLTYALSFSL